VAVVQYTFTHKQYTEQHNIFVNCNWVDTRWQLYSTHLHTNSTQNNTMKQNTQNGTYINVRILKLTNEHIKIHNITKRIYNNKNT
jgi:hypothetical protein